MGRTTVSGFAYQCDGPELGGRDLTKIVMTELAGKLAFPPICTTGDFMRKHGKVIAPNCRQTHLAAIGDDANRVLGQLSKLLEDSVKIPEHRPRQTVCTVQSDGSIDVGCPRSEGGDGCACHFVEKLRFFDSNAKNPDGGEADRLYVAAEAGPEAGMPQVFDFARDLPPVLHEISAKYGVKMVLKQVRDGVFSVVVPCSVRKDAREE